MQFKKSLVVGVVIAVCLSTDSWCHYIPEKKTSLTGQRNESAGQQPKSDQIQICGNALTTLIIEACDGIVGSPNQVNFNKDSVQTKITEDCCDQECPLDYLQNYCGDTPLFTIKKTLRGELLNRFNRNRPTKLKTRADGKGLTKERKKVTAEVRNKGKKHPRKNLGRRRKKRRKSFKWKCTYKSFGHYLLKLDRSVGARSNMAKRQNNVNRSWPSIQIGTISPEIDKFGGQPIVVVKKNKSNSL